MKKAREDGLLWNHNYKKFKEEKDVSGILLPDTGAFGGEGNRHRLDWEETGQEGAEKDE